MKTKNLTALASAFIAFASLMLARADIIYAGVNLSGAEFGQEDLPGTYGSDYSYPTDQEVVYYKSKGMNFIRLPFRWERLQHTNNAPLDPTELGRLNSFVAYATSQRMTVLLDSHNFERYYPDPNNYESSTQGLVGSAVPDSDFTNFWSQVAAIYQTNALVIFGLNNEPNTMLTSQLVTSENAAIAAIRATGATNTIFVPGNDWTGAWTWDDAYEGSANSTAMQEIVDPANNIVFEAHQYLDSDGSGTTTNIVAANIGEDRLEGFTAWLQAHHYKGFLGEFAVANNTIPSPGLGGPALTNMLGYIRANADVWLGWAWWGGGPRWGNYMFAIDPSHIGRSNQADQPVMGVVKHFFPLPIPALQLIAGAKFQFTAPQGFVYQPQSTSDLAGGVWTNYGASFAGPGGATNIGIQTGANAAGFFRVLVTHAP